MNASLDFKTLPRLQIMLATNNFSSETLGLPVVSVLSVRQKLSQLVGLGGCCFFYYAKYSLSASSIHAIFYKQHIREGCVDVL